MKKLLPIALCFLLALCGLTAHGEQNAPTTNVQYVKNGKYAYAQSEYLLEKYDITLTDGLPIYTPASPQPLKAFLATHKDCEVGINHDGMYKVKDKGLVKSITKYLEEWQKEITAQSSGAIQFVENPDDADILIVACQSYEFYGKYRGGGVTSSGYSCRIVLEARKLTAPYASATLNQIRKPSSTESTSGGAKFWKYPPEIENTPALETFVSEILAWYGSDAKINVTNGT